MAAKLQLEKVICHLQLSDSIQTFSTSYHSDGGGGESRGPEKKIGGFQALDARQSVVHYLI